VDESSRAIRGYLFDQYVRACGFTPAGPWVFVVLPSGDCEFTPLAPGEALWCCERRAEISARVSLPTIGLPPWTGEPIPSSYGKEKRNMTSDQTPHESALALSVEARLQALDPAYLQLLSAQRLPSGTFDNGFDNEFDNAFDNGFDG